MKHWMIGLGAAGLTGTLAIAGALAQERNHVAEADLFTRETGPAGWRQGPPSAEDREAFADARIAGLHAGLKLSADQEKMWPPVEEAIRGLVRQQRDARQAWRQQREQAQERDLPSMLRLMADRQSGRADALRKLADAATPLYASLDEAQKRRLVVLSRAMRPHIAMMSRGDRDGAFGPRRQRPE